MACINFPIDPRLGPIVEIGISLSTTKKTASGSSAPQIHWIKAVADSGCSHTSIQDTLIRQIGLPKSSKVPAYSAREQRLDAKDHLVDAFRGVLFIRAPLVGFPAQIVEEQFRDLLFPEIKVPLPNFGALLGMDILGLGMFTVNGPGKQATFCW